MFLRNDEDVRGSFRIDILEGKNIIVFVDFFGGKFSAQDAAEKTAAVRFTHCSSLPRRITPGAQPRKSLRLIQSH
jgi:hypothetical protein